MRPGDSLTAPENGFVDELQVLGFPHTCHPSYGGLASTPAGLTFLLNMLAFIGHTEYLDRTRSVARAHLDERPDTDHRRVQVASDPHVVAWITDPHGESFLLVVAEGAVSVLAAVDELPGFVRDC